ncbi:mutator family transposase [Cereibacter changlensis]|uniref:Mutator family transposase n=1 Tax=Cereibacter changlensis TaxID=402884 RepID=A0A2W7QWN2_9RHOB|nr:mutator family transposase [Cereibacter changlensis]
MREGGKIISRTVIVVVAVKEDGKREVLGVATGPRSVRRAILPLEDSLSALPLRTDFLLSLADRGLRGVKLATAGDGKGLRAAARRVFDASQQRRRVHWMRNALAHAPIKQRAAVPVMLKTIFVQGTKVEAEAQWAVVADAPCVKRRKLAAIMNASRNNVLANIDFTREYRAQSANINQLERVNREIKRRADAGGQ